jgi:catechol 2,3-dioxygenase-like lactoylglutathione lyase family enzyme
MRDKGTSFRLGRYDRNRHTAPQAERVMVRVVGIDHIVICVSDFARSKAFYRDVLGALGFKLKYDMSGFAGWSNGKTLFWIRPADRNGRKYRLGDVGLHHYAFELAQRADVDAFYKALQKREVEVVDPPDDYYEGGYYAVYFLDPDGIKLEAMVFDPKGLREAKRKEKKAAQQRTRPRGRRRRKQ